MAVTAAGIESHHQARAQALEALRLGGEPAEAADALDRAASAIAACFGGDEASVRASTWRGYAEALRVLSQLVRWDAAVRAADSESGRFRAAAQRNAELAERVLPEEPITAALRNCLLSLATISDPNAVPGLAAEVRAVPLPLELIPPEASARTGPRLLPARELEAPLAVCLLSIDGEPLQEAAVVEPRRVYELELRTRLTGWPEWAPTMWIEFLTVEAPQVVTLPRFELSQPERDGDGLFSVTERASLVVHAGQQAGAKPFSFPLVARFIGSKRTEPIATAGYSELRVRTFDPSRDFVTGSAQIDARVYDMFAQLHDDPAVSEHELRAFCRFFAAHVRAANLMQADRLYHGVAPITEDDFHDELHRRLRLDPELGGRLTRNEGAGGGLTDLVHDSIVSELKVEPKDPLSLEDAVRYLGQPTQYAGGKGAHLSILCLLDMSKKTTPVGVLDNYMGWFAPKLHGLDDPGYPSRVAALIINANLPLPSDWVGRKIETS